MVVWWIHDGTWQSHDGYMVVARWLHDSYMMFVWWLKEGYLKVT